MVFKWKEGSRHSVDPNVAGKVLMDLEKEGELTPERLVDISRPEDAPLHKCFTWDDRKAADLYRKQEATILIRHIEVVEEVEEKPVKVLAFHTLEKKGGYEFINNILVNPVKVTSLLANACSEMKSFKDKYKSLKELSKVFSAIEETLEAAQ